MAQKTFAFFPEAAFGPALNSVGIAQAIEKRGHKAVFLSDPGFLDVYKGYGFEAHPVNLSEPMPPEEMAKFWEDFINGHIPNFRKSPIDQLENYVKVCWESIVDSSNDLTLPPYISALSVPECRWAISPEISVLPPLQVVLSMLMIRSFASTTAILSESPSPSVGILLLMP